VSPPRPAEARSFEDVVAQHAGQLQVHCSSGCCGWVDYKVTPEQVRATGGDFAKLLPQLQCQVNCRHGGASHLIEMRMLMDLHPQYKSSWQRFFNEAWASVKASDDNEAQHSSHRIFGLVCRDPCVCLPSSLRYQAGTHS
jgi:hypothetical protein